MVSGLRKWEMVVIHVLLFGRNGETFKVRIGTGQKVTVTEQSSFRHSKKWNE